MMVLLLVSFLFFLSTLSYFFWERSVSYDRKFWVQVKIDLYRWIYFLEDRLLDRKNQIHTSFEVATDKLMVPLELKQNMRKYQATPYRVLEAVFQEIEVLRLHHYNFIDIGCGAGRALIMAHRHGFRKITGVEADKKLLQICNNNLKQYPPLYKLARLVHISAENFELPLGHSVIFLFNPFNGTILKRLLDRYAKTSGKKILIYVNPVHEELILNNGGKLLLENRHYHSDFSFKVYHLSEKSSAKPAQDLGAQSISQ